MAKRGRPFEPGNKFGRGRPPGSRNKRSLLTEDLLDEYFEPILRNALKKAKQGNTTMQRFFLERLLPQQAKDAPVEMGPLPTGTPEEMSQSQATVLAGVASGRLTAMQGEQLVSFIEGSRRLYETQQLTQRMAKIEQIFNKDGNKAA